MQLQSCRYWTVRLAPCRVPHSPREDIPAPKKGKTMNQNTVTREEVQKWIDENGMADWPLHYDGFTERLARAHLESLDKVNEMEQCCALYCSTRLEHSPDCRLTLRIERDELRSQKAALEKELAEESKLKSHFYFESEQKHIEKAALESRLDVMVKLAVAQKEINEALESQLADARKDTERLDWREAHPKNGFGLYSDGTWADGKGGSHTTYRDAIDAAGALRAKPEAWKPSDPVWPPK